MAVATPRPSDHPPVLGVDVRPDATPPAPGADRGGYVAAWALVGAVLVTLALTVWGRWITSGEQFSPAPILGPDKLPTWNLVTLRVEEALSFLEMATHFTFAVVLPLRRAGKLGLDAKIALGCLVGSVTDGVLNSREYLFAWNAHSINLGSWAEFIPTSTASQTRYAEALIWGIPMYTYFCIGVAVAGCAYITRLRVKRPGISNAAAMGRVFGYACVFDIVVENLVIRLGHGYAFVKTPSAITLDAGSQFQFPLYETFTVALLGVFFTGLRLSAIDSPDGLSYVERGAQRLRPALRQPARWLAVMGWAITTLFVVYHLPFQFFGLNGDSVADLPSYMLPGK
jgi:hypothetical protein